MARPTLTVLFIVALFGILVPYYKGYDFLDPVLLAAYFCLPVVLVAPLAAGALAGSADSVAATVGRALLVALYGWGLGMVIVAAGVITINAANWHGRMLLPGASFLAAGVFFSATATLAAVVVAGLLAHLFSAATAKTILRLLFLALLVAMVVLARSASLEWMSAFWRHMTSPELTRIGFYGGGVFAVAGAVALAVFARLRRAG
jgi:hypothetical protein